MFKFFKNLYYELLMNGKMFLTYILMEVPGLTDHPMLLQAIQAVMENPTKQGLINLLVQGALAGSAGHRAVKILVNIFNKSGIKF